MANLFQTLVFQHGKTINQFSEKKRDGCRRDNFHWVEPAKILCFLFDVLEFPRFFHLTVVLFFGSCRKVKVERLISDFQSGALF